MKYLASLLFFFLLNSSSAQGNRDLLESQRNKIIQEIEATSDLLSTTKKKKATTLEEYQLLQKQITDRESLIKNINTTIDSNNEAINKNKANIDSLTANVAVLKAQYGHLLRMVHIKKNTGLSWSSFLSFDSFNSSFKRWRAVKQFEQFVQRKKKELSHTSEAIIDENKKIAEQIAERSNMLTAERKQSDQLNSERKKKNKILSDLKSQETSLKVQLKKHQREREKLNAAIEAAILASLKSNRKNIAASTSGKAFESLKGKLQWPCQGVITAKFGNNPHPSLKNVLVANNGIDISSSKPMDVRVVADGKIVAVSKITGYDYMIIVQHNNYYTVYSKIGNVFVNGEDEVVAGHVIGNINQSQEAKHTLHFELWKDKSKLNPESWLKR